MNFNELFFLFIFLPLGLLLYYIAPKGIKNLLLVLISFLFYAWGSPVYLLILLFSTLFNYFAGRQLGELKSRPGLARAVVTGAVLVNVLLLCFFKYYGGLTELLNRQFSLSLAQVALPMPIGLSFYTFTALSYIFDVYQARTPAQRSPVRFALYMSFFPKLISGPIVRYEDMEPQLESRPFSRALVCSGANMFLVGLMKKVLLADNLGAAFAGIQALQTLSPGSAWLGALFYALQLYFDFSGYSDMALGLARLFGFQFDINFNYPYLSASISEFWRRWHISLGAWFREYVYIPLGGNRGSAGMQLRNLLVVWVLTGLWHGSSLNFLVWGLYHGFFVILERFALGRALDRLPRFLRVVPTFIIVLIGWVFFFSDSLPAALSWLGTMFGGGGAAFWDSAASYFLRGNALLLAVSLVGCGRIPRRIHQSLCYRRDSLIPGLSVLAFCLGFLVCVAYMLASTYSSFLYFQF